MPRAASLVALALAGCGGEAAPRVCDGAAGVRLAVRYELATALAPGERALYDNGATFLFVDGACTYHVKTGGRWEDVRRGTSDDATLTDALELAALPDRAGAYAGGLDGAPTLRLAFGGDEVTCAAGCSGGDVPDWAAALAARAAALLSDLASAGFTQAMPQRVLVVDEAVPPTPAFPWPASFDPATIAVLPADADATAATLVDDVADAAALRTLRRAVRDAPHPPAAAYVTTDAAQPPRYAVFVRDALPYEDAAGVVPSL